MSDPFGDSPLRFLNTDNLAYALSFATDEEEGIHNLLQVLRPPASSLGLSDGASEHESVFRALCRMHWQSVNDSKFEEEWRPSLGTWRTTYRVLQTWVPREGFYSVVDAAPWGMIIRMRFEKGTLVGDLIWPQEHSIGGSGYSQEQVMFQFIRVLAVSFNTDGVPNISLCGFGEGIGPSAMVKVDPNMPIEATVLPRWHGSFSARSGRGLQLVLPPQSSTVNEDERVVELNRAVRDIARYSLWDPATEANPLTMLRSLWEKTLAPEGRALTLDWIDGPRRDATFQYKEGMPIIRPGLYSGVYVPQEYGKFQREIILVEYKKYEVRKSNDKAECDSFWDDIQRDVFNFPEQVDDNGFFEQVKSAVTASDTDSIIIVLGRKVTGDHHVPMQRVTFGALVHPQLRTEHVPPKTVTDKGGGGVEYNVVNSWAGWGTLAYPGFFSPLWATGTLVQVEHHNQQNTRGEVGPQKFGFMWESDGTSTHETSVLTRMSEQDEFPWFS